MVAQPERIATHDEMPIVAAVVARPTSNRLRTGVRKRKNWYQLAQFSLVGGSGYVVNLAVYASLLRLTELHYLLAAVGSFLVAVTNNYLWNRLWTFRDAKAHIGFQGLKFFTVAVVALGANLVLLRLFVSLGLDKVIAQAVAIILVTPLNFIGNKLWSFRARV